MESAAASGDHYAYSCFGLYIRSDMALPELGNRHEPAADAEQPAIEIKLGPVASELANSHRKLRSMHVGDGEVQLNVHDIARYRIRDGREIIIEPAPDSTRRNVRLFLLGSAIGLLCHQRGLLPLHANAIVANGCAVAFVGASGAGKSTLAAHFSRAGYEVLCDDICVVSRDESGRPFAWPGLPRLKLWREAAENFGHDSAGLERAIEGLDKFHVPLTRVGAPTRPYPLRAVYALQVSTPEGGSEIARRRGSAALGAILHQTYRRHWLEVMGLSQQHFARCIEIANRIDVYSAPRLWGYDVFEREAEKIERHVQAVLARANSEAIPA